MAEQRMRPVAKTEGVGRSAGILAIACVCGVASGMFGVGGGVLLVPLLGLLFAFSQHRAQGTSLVALIFPTGVLLLIPGIFLGGIAGGMLAKNSEPRRMRQVFAVILVLLGAWQALGAWWR